MNNIQNVVQASYKNGKLDPDIVNKIADKLTRKELKEYIRLLKQEENKKIVTVTAPKELSEEEKKMFENLFSKKELVYNTDQKMIGGIKITDGDVEYEISLNQIFRDIIYHIQRA